MESRLLIVGNSSGHGLAAQIYRVLLRLVRYTIMGGVIGYTGLYVLWRILLLTPLYNQWWLLPLSDVFGAWFYLPLLPLLLLAVPLRDRRLLAVLALPLIMFGAEYGRQFLPNWQLLLTDSNANRPLRVMTWNMLYTADSNKQFQATLRELQPDIVVLQEVSPMLRSRAPAIVEERYPHRRIYDPGSSYGLAIFSRYPILDALASTELELYGCRCAYATIDFDGTPISVLTAHPPRPNIVYRWGWRSVPRLRHFSTQNQESPFDWLQQRVDLIDGPLLVMGDLNSTERQPNYQRLRHSLYDAFAAAGWGMGHTYPNHARWPSLQLVPFIRIDHILHSKHWLARAAWTGRLNSSDHLYVVADLALLSD